MAAPPRRLPSWIDGFMAHSEPRKSPEIFRKWAAISTVSGAMERKLFIRTKGGELYSNLYVFMVGPPATGKTVALKAAEPFLRSLEGMHVAPTNLSGAAFIDALNEAQRKIVSLTEPFIEYNSLVLFSSELSALLPVYDEDFMAKLTDIYDGFRLEERKRGGGLRINIPKPYVTLLGGTTPEYLNNFLPEGAWGQGFMSRVLMVFAGESLKRELFFDNEDDEEIDEPKARLVTELEKDLAVIYTLGGRIRMRSEVKRLIQAWEDSGGPPAPTHPNLINYIGRRTVMLMKLCMISAVDRSNELIIEVVDYQRALGWLMEAEVTMADIFKSMITKGTDGVAIIEAWDYLLTTYSRGGFKPVMEHILIRFLQNRVPLYTVPRVIETMLKSNMMERGFEGGNAVYKPKKREEHSN